MIEKAAGQVDGLKVGLGGAVGVTDLGDSSMGINGQWERKKHREIKSGAIKMNMISSGREDEGWKGRCASEGEVDSRKLLRAAIDGFFTVGRRSK